MSEDDRAAKAARAKALLKKRQMQKKVGGTAPARAFSPAPSDALGTEDEKSDFGDVFSKTPVDGPEPHWLASLPRVESNASLGVLSPSTKASSLPAASPPTMASPPTVASPPTPTIPPHITQELDELRALATNQKQTISLLVADKSSLTASLEQLEEVESKLQVAESALQEERTVNSTLHESVQHLEDDAKASTNRIEQLSLLAKDLTEQCRDQERELQLLKATSRDLRSDSERYERRVRELEEQIQNDDRVERLEVSLKNTQDRADELEFQLSKLKQVHSSLKSEYDDVQTQMQHHTESALTLQTKLQDLQGHHTASQAQISALTAERDGFRQDKSALESAAETSRAAIATLQKQVTQAATDLAAASRQTVAAQAELRSAQRRAEEAEKIQVDLQSEGTSLMRTLDEMRPRLAELTRAQEEWEEQRKGLEHEMESRDATIAQLEGELNELRGHRDELEQERREADAATTKERTSLQDSLSELQNAYDDLHAELDNAHGSVRNLESERASQHQAVSQLQEEISRISASTRSKDEQITSLRQELAHQEHASSEARDLVENYQNEIDLLRNELSSKDQEIEQLRYTVAATSPGASSLDSEMISALKQQHALGLSNAHSRIRDLETAVFEAEAKAHGLQKQVSTLDDQLSHLRSSSRSSHRPFSPSIPSRPVSRGLPHLDEQRRPSFSSRKSSNLAPPVPRSTLDQDLSPETRHKRKVSLSMLKARIDSEMATAQPGPSPRAMSPVPVPKRSALPTVQEPPTEIIFPQEHLHRRAQFLDESHIFWCHSCRGDLVIL